LIETPRLTVDCVVFNADGVVLIRRGVEPYKGWFALPGGFVEIGESVEHACSREMEEETGLKIDSNVLKLIGVYSAPDRDPRRHTVSIAFLGHSNLETLQAGDDAAHVEVVKDWREINIAFDHKKIIENAWSLHNTIERTTHK